MASQARTAPSATSRRARSDETCACGSPPTQRAHQDRYAANQPFTHASVSATAGRIGWTTAEINPSPRRKGIAGSASPERVAQWAKWVDEPVDETLLREVQEILAPIKDWFYIEGRPENNDEPAAPKGAPLRQASAT
jgi:hypothetical protein